MGAIRVRVVFRTSLHRRRRRFGVQGDVPELACGISDKASLFTQYILTQWLLSCHDVCMDTEVVVRADRFAALGDPARLAIVDELARSDRASIELQAIVDLPSNLLAHHLDVLERVGLITRHRSSGDGRRRYVHLEPSAFAWLAPLSGLRAGRALFVCTHNSARSQLAAALWEARTGQRAQSAGTHPAENVHPGALSAARRAHLTIVETAPQHLDQITSMPPLVVTVCDRAHEELEPPATWLHWSIPDPVAASTKAAFDHALHDIDERITAFAGSAAS